MKLLLAPTEDFIRKVRSALNGNIAAGSSIVVPLLNSNGFLVNDYVVIGLEGSEQAEMCQITAVTLETITVATTLLAHVIGEPVVKYRYNKRKFYGCATPTGTFLELVSYGSPVVISVGDPQGTQLEYTGSEGYVYFKATYFNSTESVESSTADADTVLADESLRYASIYAIRKHAGLAGNPYYSDGRIETKRKQAENEINSVVFARYELPLSEVPALISYICELLAAGYLDYEEFGSDGEGVKWLGTARALLKSISEGTQRLIGVDGTELTTKSQASSVQSYPDEVDNVNGPSRMFSTRQVF